MVINNNKLLLSEEKQQILDAILSLELAPSADKEEEDENTKKGDRLVSTQDNIRKRGRLIQRTYPGEQKLVKDWKTQLRILVTEELIQKVNFEDNNLVYTLTEIGRPHAKQRRQDRIGRYFSDFHIRSDKSKTYSSFCNQVFGKDLNQANLMDMVQLDKLLEVLNLNSENRILDLACGIGRIAEYISDTTQAHVLGIDMAATAIKRAQERTREKRNRLEFQVGDINNLAFDEIDVDTVIGIATLHYIEDLNKVVKQLKEALPPNGQMGFFTFQYRAETDSSNVLFPENTKLGQVLNKNNLKFQTWDFTNKEIEIRRKQIQIAQELRRDFQEEGNEDLCNDRIEECEIDLPRLETGKKRRYLYHVQLS